MEITHTPFDTNLNGQIIQSVAFPV